MFTVYGPGFADPIRLEKLLQRPDVSKLSATQASRAMDAQDIPAKESWADISIKPKDEKKQRHQKQRHQALPTYTTSQPKAPVFKAEQVMTKPVVFVYPDTPAMEAWKMFDHHGFRHLPVLSEEKRLLGILSDRDLMRCRCEHSVCMHCGQDKEELLVDALMHDRVVTAELETDARAIARLFVESRIGAVPIVEHQQLKGIVTRSDLLRAVMHDFHLNVWM
ncbi:MAG: CBS domain-containing protein [Mariprofundaceae bacterium]|nr:CBS domain-containing protein [Mariprofundaceae bacterium]